jgi:hypothetical protein
MKKFTRWVVFVLVAFLGSFQSARADNHFKRYKDMSSAERAVFWQRSYSGMMSSAENEFYKHTAIGDVVCGSRKEMTPKENEFIETYGRILYKRVGIRMTKDTAQIRALLTEAMVRLPESILPIGVDYLLPQYISISTELIILRECADLYAKENPFQAKWKNLIRINVKEKVGASLLDPESARYDFGKPNPVSMEFDEDKKEMSGNHERVHYGWQVPFYVNSKNKYGAYSGRKEGTAFYVDGLFWVEDGHSALIRFEKDE